MFCFKLHLNFSSNHITLFVTQCHHLLKHFSQSQKQNNSFTSYLSLIVRGVGFSHIQGESTKVMLEYSGTIKPLQGNIYFNKYDHRL